MLVGREFVKTILLAADIYENGPIDYRQEWESKKSVSLLKESLTHLGYVVIIRENPSEIAGLLLEFIVKNKSEDLVVFNLVEGFLSRNREGYIPNLCEYLGICYTGSDAYAQAISLDKHLLKTICDRLGILTPKYTLARTKTMNVDSLNFPLFVKPNGEGSSIGISEENIIYSLNQLTKITDKLFLKFDELLIEEYISGDDITIGLIGSPNQYHLTSPARVTYDSKVYSEGIKSKDGMPEQLSFDLPTDVIEKLSQICLRLAEHLKIFGPARFDFRLDSRGIYFLELNLTPGLSKIYSTLPKCYFQSGFSYEDLLQKIILSAEERYLHFPEQKYGRRIYSNE